MKLDESKLVKVSEFARNYPRTNGGTGVNHGYIYKLDKAAKEKNASKELGWQIVNVSGFNFVQLF